MNLGFILLPLVACLVVAEVNDIIIMLSMQHSIPRHPTHLNLTKNVVPAGLVMTSITALCLATIP